MATVLIDFPGAPRRCFRDPEGVLAADTLPDVRGVLREAERAAKAGFWVAGYVSYEAAPAFEPALHVAAGARMPLAWFGVYRTVDSSPTVSSTDSAPAPLSWAAGTTQAEHADAVQRIRAAIADGEVYQVNHTFRLHARSAVVPRALYESLRAAQPDAFGAYLELDGFRILSISPELFFERTGELVRTRPMKGTRPRGRWEAEDASLRAELAGSEKDRAENLMIVDLLRNDLGRVARIGSVRVPQLFAIERYRTVWQMTSTIEADVPATCGLDELFAALFPCGSVTGAPKIAATRFIAALEHEPREVYCGAIGVLRPGGDCTFSVAIRTAWQDYSTGALQYGVGGGITWDSDAAAEWEEALSKAAVLRRAWPAEFQLLETMRSDAGVIARRARHIERLLSAARYFDFSADARAIEAALDAQVPATGSWRVRLLVGREGQVVVATSPLTRPPERLPLLLARTPVDSADPFLYHKTTHRRVYEHAAAEHPDAPDVLLTNERGELTEFTRGNLVVELDGELYTPALEAGLLPGVFRAELLDKGLVRERVMRSADLERVTRAWRVSSLWQWVPVATRAYRPETS